MHVQGKENVDVLGGKERGKEADVCGGYDLNVCVADICTSYIRQHHLLRQPL